jgi:lipid-binding SYLF domain-containing protein
VTFKPILFLAVCALAVPVLPARQSPDSPPNRRLQNAADSLREIMDIPDKGIPRDLFDKSKCIIIIPGLKKSSFLLGAKYGRGYAACRQGDRSWGPPAAVGIEGASVGFQFGGSSTDVVMLVMNDDGMRHLLSNKFTLGGEAAVAAGPVGRNASANTDIFATAGILAWSRSRGIFAGLSLDGATFHADGKENRKLYGKPVNNREILMGEVPAPATAEALMCALDEYTPGVTSPCGNSTARSLSETGRAALSEVHFASAKAEILPESEPALTPRRHCRNIRTGRFALKATLTIPATLNPIRSYPNVAPRRSSTGSSAMASIATAFPPRATATRIPSPTTGRPKVAPKTAVSTL